MKLFIAMTMDGNTLIVQAETLKDFYQKMADKELRIKHLSEVQQDIIIVRSHVSVTTL